MTKPLDYINLAITKQVPETWQPAYIEETELPKLHAETLGILVSKWCEHDCDTLIEVFIAALEDSNYEDLAAELTEWLSTND